MGGATDNYEPPAEFIELRNKYYDMWYNGLSEDNKEKAKRKNIKKRAIFLPYNLTPEEKIGYATWFLSLPKEQQEKVFIDNLFYQLTDSRWPKHWPEWPAPRVLSQKVLEDPDDPYGF